jgi:hypothetical protein
LKQLPGLAAVALCLRAAPAWAGDAPSEQPTPAPSAQASFPLLPEETTPPVPPTQALPPAAEPKTAPPRHAPVAEEPPRRTPAAPPDAEPNKHGFSGSAEVTGTQRTLFGIPVNAVELRASVGPPDSFSRGTIGYGFLGLMLGRTAAGLSLGHVVAGGRFEGRASYFHAGLALGFGAFQISRARGGHLDLNPMTVGECFAGLQFPLGDHAALSLDAGYALELLPGHDDTVMPGPGVTLRARFY